MLKLVNPIVEGNTTTKVSVGTMFELILKVRVPTPTELTVMLEEEKDPLVKVPAVVEEILMPLH